MKNFEVRLYRDADSSAWNAFIGNARNATFLFHRDFMDYHRDRFRDHSLVVSQGGKWIAAMPANITGNTLFSHAGLTYGGLVYGEKAKLPMVIQAFQAVLKYLDETSVTALNIKMMPPIYHLKPSDELAYAIFLADGKLVRRDSLSVLDLHKPFSFSKDRRKCALRGEKHGLKIVEEAEFGKFWDEILSPNLDAKHSIKPVHSAEEIDRLHKAFPHNIRHFNVYDGPKLVAGTTVFVTDTVAHPQYISGDANKNELGSLDFLYRHLIVEVFKDRKFFDFGISNEQQGRKLNEGLVFWKETFGAGTFVQDFYEIQTANYKLLDDVLI